jgi:hypothetical protein
MRSLIRPVGHLLPLEEAGEGQVATTSLNPIAFSRPSWREKVAEGSMRGLCSSFQNMFHISLDVVLFMFRIPLHALPNGVRFMTVNLDGNGRRAYGGG